MGRVGRVRSVVKRAPTRGRGRAEMFRAGAWESHGPGSNLSSSHLPNWVQ